MGKMKVHLAPISPQGVVDLQENVVLHKLVIQGPYQAASSIEATSSQLHELYNLKSHPVWYSGDKITIFRILI